jgi:adenylate cyclase class 2
MIEIEVKARVGNLDILKQQLSELGCVFSKPVVQDDSIFLANGILFSDIRQGHPVLRIRRSGDKCMLTLKKNVSTDHELLKLEEEVVVSDGYRTAEILKHMGYRLILQLQKERCEARYKDMTICLDRVKDLGDFIEVEKLTDTEDMVAVRAGLVDFLHACGIEQSAQVTKGYDTLMMDKINKV